MSSWLYFLLLCGLYLQFIVIVNGESQICGYSGDSYLCCSGYKKDDQGECSLPICENDCGQGGECIRPDKCYCSNGRVASSCLEENQQNNDEFEKKVDKPEMCSNNCNGQGLCINGKCKCHLGYSGLSCLDKEVNQCYLSLSRGICQKLDNEIKLNFDECCSAFDVAWGDPCQKCPRSRCQKGYIEINGMCRDFNECNIPELCRNGRCENTEGSYKCLCSTGYQFDQNKGDCIKIKDVCKQRSNICGDGMTCLTLGPEKYSCQCLEGYTKAPDHNSCVRKEVNTFDFCAIYGGYVCQFGKCKTFGNNYKCECNPGYRLSGDSKSCKKNIDYCALYQNILCPNGVCVSVDDDYICKCNSGYTPSFNRKKCTSVCDLYPTSLCPNARCIPNAEGGYECQCNEGFSAIGKGKQCRRIMNDQSVIQNSATITEAQSPYDVDYCSYNYYRKQCLGGRCINKKSYYQCECLHGYVTDKNGLACKKIDYVVSGQMLDMAGSIELKSYCDKYGSFLCNNGHCVESGSSYQCRCNSGYQESSDGKSCYDIDECSVDSNVCVQGTCTNSPGSYQCSCYDGFTIHYVPGGPKCYDRNECEEDHLLCINGRCINKWGGYSCSCNSGYIISNNDKQCVSVRSKTESQVKLQELNCKDCKRSCKKINETSFLCECPIGQSSVLNTGICVPMSQVVDIQFDLTIPTRTRFKRNINHPKFIFFRLIMGSDKDTFIKQVSSRFRNIVINECKSLKEITRDGILCSFYDEYSN